MIKLMHLLEASPYGAGALRMLKNKFAREAERAKAVSEKQEKDNAAKSGTVDTVQGGFWGNYYDPEKKTMHGKFFTDKKQAQEFAKGNLSVEEDINIPVNKGDTILGGKWKNKKIKVKSISKDEYDMPTINDRKVVNFRMAKKEKENEAALPIVRKKLGEENTINTKDVPVYSKDGKILGYVRKSATSIGAAKLANSRSAEYSSRFGKPGWIVKEEVSNKKLRFKEFTITPHSDGTYTLSDKSGNTWKYGSWTRLLKDIGARHDQVIREDASRYWQYVKRIKNPSKKAYAAKYLQWIQGGKKGTEPERPVALSYMGAQSVRLQLRDMMPKPVTEDSPETGWGHWKISKGEDDPFVDGIV